ECLSFHFTPALIDTIGERKRAWKIGALAPLPELMVVAELAQAAADGDSDVGVEEAGMLLAARFVDTASGQERRSEAASPRDRRRAVETAMWLDQYSHRPLDLDAAAREAGLSPFHFLRLFSKVL